MKEKETQKLILEWLGYQKIFHYRNNSGGMVSTYKDKTYFMKFGAPGSPDIICVVKGRYIGIEVKSDIGVQSDSQKDFQERLEKAGGLYILARSLDDVITGLSRG
jgi:hypothetical protein